MAKLSLTDLSGGYQSVTVFNANNTLIEAALENTLSRDGTTPNTMSANLDMNSNKVVNVTDPTNAQDAATKAYVDAVEATLAGGTYLENLVEDLTPQLGGALDLNGQNITAAGPTTISSTEISYLDGVTSNLQTQIDAKGTVSTLSDLGVTSTAAEINLLDLSVAEVVSGEVLIGSGAGTAGWRALVEADISDLGTYLTDVVSDTTPQLGGNLDLNSQTINGTGTIGITGAITATSFGGISSSNLVDKSASESVTGAWYFTNEVKGVPAARSVTSSENTLSTDEGIVINLTGGTGQTFTLDADPATNALVFFDNSSGASWTIAASTSLIWAKDATTGNRTLADDGVAIAKHRGSGTWIISGSALLT